MDGLCVWASESHDKILGYPARDMVGHHWKDMVSPEDHAHADLAGSDALLHGRSIEFGFRAATTAGTRVPMRCNAVITADQLTHTPYLVFHGVLVPQMPSDS